MPERPEVTGRWNYPHRKVDVLGVRVSDVDVPGLVDALRQAVQHRSKLTVSFVNPNYIMSGLRDPDLQAEINRFDVLLADGWGVVLAARCLGRPIGTRMANDDLEGELFRACDQGGWRVFLFGSAPGVADLAAANLTAGYPRLRVVGTVHGWLDVERGHPGRFDAADADLVIAKINEAEPDLLIVGLPTPLQQRWVMENLDRLLVPVIMTGGSYLDHLAEHLRWYPPLVDRLRLDWLYRLARDPRRLWRRYTLELLDFGRRVLRARVRERMRSG